jgi:Zn-finger protein
MERPADHNATYMGFTHRDCPFYPCHDGVNHAFNCLYCYCPLYPYQCPGTYHIIIDGQHQPRKDCSACTLPHDGYDTSWQLIQHWLQHPQLWQPEHDQLDLQP